jgi:hypothetical protein
MEFPCFLLFVPHSPGWGGWVGGRGGGLAINAQKKRVLERSEGYVVFVLLILEGGSFLVLIPADFDTVESESDR